MGKKLIYQTFVLFLLNFSLIPESNSSEASFVQETEARLTIYNVGMGQCCNLEIYDPSKAKKHSILIGFGIDKMQFKDHLSKDSSKSPKKTSQVFLDPSHYRAFNPMTPLSSQELIKVLRSKFKRKGSLENVIDVEVVILTNSLKDSGLLMDLFKHEADHLGQLWLAGLPEDYYSDRQDQFLNWLREKSLRKTKIHFLALVKPTLASLYEKETRIYEPAYFTSIVKEGEENLSFAGVKISFLSVNPTHFQGRNQEILRSSFPEDTQSDSLLIKILYGSSSVLLTGNATSLTTNRALNNYIDLPHSLQANVLVASSYGSTSHSANEREWLYKVDPEYVVISHGDASPTFEQGLYETFKSLKRLKNSVTRHELQVQLPKVATYSTNKAIFSTLSSGTVRIDIHKKHLIFRTRKEGKISHQIRSLEKLDKQEEIALLSPTFKTGHHLMQSIHQEPSNSHNLSRRRPKSVSLSPQVRSFSE